MRKVYEIIKLNESHLYIGGGTYGDDVEHLLNEAPQDEACGFLLDDYNSPRLAAVKAKDFGYIKEILRRSDQYTADY